jgi:hypothetical protein
MGQPKHDEAISSLSGETMQLQALDIGATSSMITQMQSPMYGWLVLDFTRLEKLCCQTGMVTPIGEIFKKSQRLRDISLTGNQTLNNTFTGWYYLIFLL